jgi:uncharacterized protein (DUF488 family)
MTDGRPGAPRRIFTIGHSNHSLPTFLELLAQHQIEVLADVRSHPYSRYASHFNIHELRSALTDVAVRYVHLGAELGGRPPGDGFYGEDGRVLYWRVAQAPFFLSGLDRLERGCDQHRVAMMCSEEDPLGCHRHLLIGRVLNQRGTLVEHIRANGALEPASYEAPPQMLLFTTDEDTTWTSIRPVSPRRTRSGSSEAYDEPE